MVLAATLLTQSSDYSAVARMTSNSDNESESSLPIQTAQSPSSPPILKIDASILDMDVNPALMSEPALAQDVEASRPALHGVSSDDTERPPSAQQLHHDSREQGDVDDDKELHDKESDPAERIAEFDWDDLHARYHEAVGKCHGEEAELMQEWEALMIVLLRSPGSSEVLTRLVFSYLGRIWPCA